VGKELEHTRWRPTWITNIVRHHIKKISACLLLMGITNRKKIIPQEIKGRIFVFLSCFGTGDRTQDLVHAMQVLYPLEAGPQPQKKNWCSKVFT
jgi:hypothetical protein